MSRSLNSIHFTKKNTDSAEKTSLTIDNLEIKPKQEIKYLGIIWDSALTWKPHIRYIEKKMAYPLYRLSRIAKHIPTKCALAIYKTTIRPIMEYGLKFIMAEATRIQFRLDRLRSAFTTP